MECITQNLNELSLPEFTSTVYDLYYPEILLQIFHHCVLSFFFTLQQRREELGYGPRTLDMRFRTELAYLESLEESLRQLADLYRVHAVTGTKQDNIALAEIVQVRTLDHVALSE
jgi:hypothetical protein